VTTWWPRSFESWYKSRNYSIPTAEALYLGYNAHTDRNALQSDKNLDGGGCGPIASINYPDAGLESRGSPQPTNLSRDIRKLGRIYNHLFPVSPKSLMHKAALTFSVKKKKKWGVRENNSIKHNLRQQAVSHEVPQSAEIMTDNAITDVPNAVRPA